jgi:hypothetical protein
VQSFSCFYTDDSVTTIPEITGEWNVIVPGQGSRDRYRTWNISSCGSEQYSLDTCDGTNNMLGELRLTFFRCGSNVFCDVTAELNETVPIDRNQYWLSHIRPMHTVSMVQVSSNELVFIPLSYDWLCRSDEEGVRRRNGLPYLYRRQDEDVVSFLFTALPENWMGFLNDIGSNTNAFDREHSYMFRRSANTH